ncbi:fibronectin type III domain-containing protein [Saccharothrix australiensis]|uniref:Fibronectin type III domain protein n=1 Tax=Saccharothrix australiensis TaxID=2072 RepID=A0A495W517_9PSEU|nr:fibronectin type III domain-containing protein [Saccharothrix australiensis]RKT55743.1 fibronectin type III domain protein [Saccharothrix australiensis]
MIITRSASRKGGPYALVAVLCAAVLVATLTGATRPLSAAAFTTTGHWVYNSVLGVVFHIDGGTANVDARLPVDAEVGSQVLQGDTRAFVVGQGRITPFDKATLSPQGSVPAPADEHPLGIEVVGGPYAVYRGAGKVVRLGDPTATIAAGGPIGNPVVTDDGTMWLHRTGVGSICTIARSAVELSGCPVSAPADHAGALTVVGGRPAFVDLFTGSLHTVDNGVLGPGKALGVSLSPNSRPAARDLGGRVAILDPIRRNLVLVDPDARPAAAAVTVPLPAGDYDGPVSTGDVVALVERKQGTVLTFGPDGARRDEKPVKRDQGEPRLSQGEDRRVYVEDSDGTQVLVVAEDGRVRDVDVSGKQAATPQSQPQPPDDTSEPDVGVPTPGNGRRDPLPGRQHPDQRGTDQRATDQREPDRQDRTTPPPPPAPVPAGRPGAPPSVLAQAGNGSATVTWGEAPDNRAPITSYLVSWQGGGGSGSFPVGGDQRQAVVEGLVNGERYVITVAATNQVGAGPGTSANPVVPVAPVSPAAPPVGLKASYDPDDRPTRDVTVSWGQPALNGGTLVHYVVAATGQGTRQVTATEAKYKQLEAATAYTFTVHAVTRTPDGQLLDGEAASISIRDEKPKTASAHIEQGGPSQTDRCHPPACAWVNATMSGLDPNTTYLLRLSSNSTLDVRTEPFTTDATGAAVYNKLNYDVPGERVWVTVLTESRQEVIESNRITWK